MNEAKLTAVANHDYYPEPLQKKIAAFNAELAAIATARPELQGAADALRVSAVEGTIEKPEQVLEDVDKLCSQAVTLDVKELRLIQQKGEFQKPVLDARKTEKERAAMELEKRSVKLGKELDKVSTEVRYRQGIINEDSKVKGFKAAQGAVSQYLRIVTEEDEARQAVLQSRVAAIVPSFA